MPCGGHTRYSERRETGHPRSTSPLVTVFLVLPLALLAPVALVFIVWRHRCGRCGRCGCPDRKQNEFRSDSRRGVSNASSGGLAEAAVGLSLIVDDEKFGQSLLRGGPIGAAGRRA